MQGRKSPARRKLLELGGTRASIQSWPGNEQRTDGSWSGASRANAMHVEGSRRSNVNSSSAINNN